MFKLKNKLSIFRYYTFLNSFIALIVSFIFSIFLINNIIYNNLVPEYIKGLRYVATCGLVATMIIYKLFLSNKSQNLISSDDFKAKTNLQKTNIIIHYVCPIISLVSFIFFERQIELLNSKWTLYTAIPSCLYWSVYLILSTLKLWEEPYDFSNNSKKNNQFKEMITYIGIPILFIVLSYILWNIK